MVTLKSTQAKTRLRGFSLIEMMVSLAVLSLVLGVVFEAMSKYQKRYTGQQRIISKTQDLRGAVSLIEEEVGQAGADMDTVRTLTSAVTASTLAQTLPLNNTAGLFAGEKLRVDVRNSEEYLTLTSFSGNTATAVVQKSHAAGAPVVSVGPFPTGILTASTNTVAKFYGAIYPTNDINYVEYRYDPVGQTLCRSLTPISAGAKAPCEIFMQNVTAANFAYDWQLGGGVNICKRLTVNLTVQTAQQDPETNAFIRQSATAEISPRNLLAAYQLASGGSSNNLQAQPANVPFP
jgi:prepilin-type N-terminal cleavage/methylation domain-containing protein